MMMDVRVLRLIDDLHAQDWSFAGIDYELRLSGYRKLERKTKWHKWLVTTLWSVYDKRGSTLNEPVYPPQDVQDEALQIQRSKIHVTFDWK